MKQGTHFVVSESLHKLVEIEGRGICFMHSTGIGKEGCEEYHEVNESSWCPDYVNKKKEKQTLDDWIKSCYEKEQNESKI